MVRKDIISYNSSNLTDGELYPIVEKAVIKEVKDMSLKDLRRHFITERIDYYMNHADEDELDIILDGEKD
tara:strand:- start:675 stop:884 length:210 start_codon:yes stop_codon:yes gene_type:complete